MRRELALLVMDDLHVYRGCQGARTSPCCSAACASDQAAGDGADKLLVALLETAA